MNEYENAFNINYYMNISLIDLSKLQSLVVRMRYDKDWDTQEMFEEAITEIEEVLENIKLGKVI